MIPSLNRGLFGSTSGATFQFRPRWKEELVVIGPGGKFILELPMGIFSVYLPTEEAWAVVGPEWAKDLWPVLRMELEEWCNKNKADLHVFETASVLFEE